MKIALATCANLPDWEVDDHPFHAALAARGVEVFHPAWDDPDFDWSACDACLIRTTWDYMDRRDEYVAWAERVARRTRLFNPAPIVRWNTHKRYLRDLEGWRVPITPSVWFDVGQRVNLAAVLGERGWKRAFLKPVIGATARETLRFDADEEGIARAKAHLDRMLRTESMILQPYLERVEREGEYSVVVIDPRSRDGGEALTYAVRKIPVPGDYRVQDDFGAHDEPAELDDDAVEICRRILGRIEHDLLYARVDFLRDDEGGLRLSELELVEPSLLFRHCPAAAERLAEALCRRIAPGG